MDDGWDLRSASLSDLAVIADLAVQSGLFDFDGWGQTEGIVRSCVAGETTGHVWIASRGDCAIAAAYVAADPFAHSMWNLYFLAVAPTAQGAGCGSALVGHVETAARQSGVFRRSIQTGFERVIAGGIRSVDGPFHLPVRCASGTEKVLAAQFVYLNDASWEPAGAAVGLRPAAYSPAPSTAVVP